MLFDEPGAALFDVPAAKPLAVDLAHLVGVAERQDRTSGAPYLVLRYEDREVALTGSGIAFAPVFEHTGPLELPQAVCLKDYAVMLDRLKHDLYGHPDVPPTRDSVRHVMMCLAVLEGARAVGFDVAREEAELEKLLGEVERRAC